MRRRDLTYPETFAWARTVFTDKGIEFVGPLCRRAKADSTYDRHKDVSFRDLAFGVAWCLRELGRFDLVRKPSSEAD
jgi:hypothetical protein